MSTVFVTAGQVPTVEQTPVTVIVTAVQTALVSSSSVVNQVSSTSSSENSLPLAWILAIIAFVIVAIESTALVVLYKLNQSLRRNRAVRDDDVRRSLHYEMRTQNTKQRNGVVQDYYGDSI